jgi:hypothetical protein
MSVEEVLLMKRITAKSLKIFLLTAVLLLSVLIPSINSLAAPTDEILDFTVTVDVNEDASLEMLYHIDWEVLDDKAYGPLEWIDLGVPNSSHSDINALTDTIDHITDNGSTLAISLDREYYAGETVSLEFRMTQDRMYQIDKWEEGETEYSFTPAWFDGMDVDQLTIRWNSENAVGWQPDCMIEDGYLIFTSEVPAGGRYSIAVRYPNEAFGFVPERQADSGSGTSISTDWTGSSPEDPVFMIIGIVFFLVIMIVCFAVPIIIAVKFFSWLASGEGFGSSQTTEKKITRTKIEYYDNCPSCGAARKEGKDNCEYCGRSMIKKKEVVEENQIEKPEKYTKNGTYRYGDSPNTYIHVNVVNVPVISPRPSSNRSSHSGGSSRHSSCASSCACACASSCACACACASSGRAGCSVKDFFKDSIHKGRVRVDRK